MKDHQLGDRILNLLIDQEFGEIEEADKIELLKLLEEDKASGGDFELVSNDRDKLIDRIIELTKDDKDELVLQRAKAKFFEMIKGK